MKSYHHVLDELDLDEIFHREAKVHIVLEGVTGKNTQPLRTRLNFGKALRKLIMEGTLDKWKS